MNGEARARRSVCTILWIGATVNDRHVVMTIRIAISTFASATASAGRDAVEKKKGEEGVTVFNRENRGICSTRNTRNTDPFKRRSDESLALFLPYLQQRCSVHPHHPACTQQGGENLPIGADPSGSCFASPWRKRLPIVRLWSCCVLGDFEINYILRMTRQLPGSGN